eukprot:Skav207667  [mRNA]  locus=scaffold1857:195285:199649:+ [translate_table: standard]
MVLSHTTCEWDNIHSVIEMCCGAGYMGVGARVAGLRPVLGCDQNPKWTQAYQDEFDLPVVTGDVCSVVTISEVWSLAPSHTGIIAGVSCQPYSSLGDRRGGDDVRSTSLTGVLEAIHWLQAPYAVIECVKNAGEDPFFLHEVKEFCRQTKFTCHEIILDLHDIWPSRRTRWWGVLVSPALHMSELKQFPSHAGVQKISQILTEVMSIPPDELNQLRLSEVESVAFAAEGHPSRYLVNENGVLPTALHAWGNQITGCPCDCRANGFSSERLQARGLHGVLFPIPGEDAFRHIHASELAVLTGNDPYQEWGDQRFALCGLGQLASPLQSMWICSQIRTMLDRYRLGRSLSTPFHDLQAYMSWVLTRANMIWPSAKVVGELKELMHHWKPLMTFDMEQLLKFDFWGPQHVPLSIGTILDMIVQVSDDTPLHSFLQRESLQRERALLEEVRDAVIQISPTQDFEASDTNMLSVLSLGEGTEHMVRVSPDATVNQVLHAEAMLRQCRPDQLQGVMQGCVLSPDTLLHTAGTIGIAPVESRVAQPMTDDAQVVSDESDMPVDDEQDAKPDDLMLVPSPDRHMPVELKGLQGDSLLNLPGPTPTLLDQLHATKTQAIEVKDRQEILENQQQICADDELCWHLHQLLAENLRRGHQPEKPRSFEKLVVLDPLLLHGWIKNGPQHVRDWCYAFCVSTACVVSIALLDGHWVPVVMWKQDAKLIVQTWDEQTTDHEALNKVCSAFATCLGCETPEFQRFHRMFVSQRCCGALALGFLHHVVLHSSLPETNEQALALHSQFRQAFTNRLSQPATCVRPWLWGAGNSDVLAPLAEILKQNGVPQEEAENRANAAIKALGHRTVQQALESKTPWRQLKAVGNHVKFQFLLPSELQAKIEKNAGKHKPRGSKKPREGPAESNYQLDPHKLVIAEGCFQHQGHAVGQLQFQQIGPLAEGVVLTSAVEAEAYVRANQVVSKCPLALIVVNGTPGEARCSLPHAQVTVPCRCAMNKEPLLVEATMIQIGTGHVEKASDRSLVKVDALEVSTMKLLVYRDEVSDWSEVTGSPMKYILGKLPMLCTCDIQACQCPKWHPPAGSPTRSVLLDVWRRQFLKQFKSCSPAEAIVFSVCIRIPTSLIFDVMGLSGTGGVYMEPRSQDGREVDQDFAVTWVPKMTKSEGMRLKQTDDQVLGLVRMNDRWGLRSTANNAAMVHARIRPDTAFLSMGNRQQFMIGPMPFGADRAAITRAMKTLQWDIKPLQPVSSLPNKGNMWVVLTVCEPPENLVRMDHGEVMITRHKTSERDTKQVVHKPVASTATIHLCAEKTESNDPWLQDDPWASGRPLAPAAPVPSAVVQKLEEKIEQSVLDRLAQSSTSMVQDDVPDRLQQLEANFQLLVGQHQALENKVAESDQRQSNQLASLQVQVNQQGLQLRGAIDAQAQNMGALFESQMQQIRSLLSKRRIDDENNME